MATIDKWHPQNTVIVANEPYGYISIYGKDTQIDIVDIDEDTLRFDTYSWDKENQKWKQEDSILSEIDLSFETKTQVIARLHDKLIHGVSFSEAMADVLQALFDISFSHTKMPPIKAIIPNKENFLVNLDFSRGQYSIEDDMLSEALSNIEKSGLSSIDGELDEQIAYLTEKQKMLAKTKEEYGIDIRITLTQDPDFKSYGEYLVNIEGTHETFGKYVSQEQADWLLIGLTNGAEIGYNIGRQKEHEQAILAQKNMGEVISL